MTARGLVIRADVASAPELRRLAKKEPRRRTAQRMLALANAMEGMSRADAARAAGIERQALRDAVVRFNAEGLAGLVDRPYGRRPERLSEGEQAVLVNRILLGFERLLAEQPMKLAHLVQSEAGTTSSSAPVAVSAPWAAKRRHVNSWFGAMPCWRATKLTVMPGAKVCSTSRTFSAAVQRRRRWTEVMISTRSGPEVLVISSHFVSWRP
jgi:transposase